MYGRCRLDHRPHASFVPSPSHPLFSYFEWIHPPQTSSKRCHHHSLRVYPRLSYSIPLLAGRRAAQYHPILLSLLFVSSVISASTTPKLTTSAPSECWVASVNPSTPKLGIGTTNTPEGSSVPLLALGGKPRRGRSR